MQKTKKLTIAAYLWQVMGLYLILASTIGLMFSTRLDATNGYRSDARKTMVISLAYGAAFVVAAIGLKREKTWSKYIIILLSVLCVLYGAIFFAKNGVNDSGAILVAFQSFVGAFSLFALRESKDIAQPRP